MLKGGRGGQAFICEVLRPENQTDYGIETQSHMQFLSILLVVAALTADNVKFQKNGVPLLAGGSKKYLEITFEDVLRRDFALDTKVGVIFRPLLSALFIAVPLAFAFVATVFYSYWGWNLYGNCITYATQLASVCIWIIGALGLLILGGNPRVRLVSQPIKPHIEQGLGDLERADPLAARVEINFGSLHGSQYRVDKGTALVDKNIIRWIAGLKLQTVRSRMWILGFLVFGMMLLTSIALQVVGATVATIGSESLGIAILLATSICRGAGIAGPEDWMIPSAWRRKGTYYGATLLGRFANYI